MRQDSFNSDPKCVYFNHFGVSFMSEFSNKKQFFMFQEK